MTLQITPEILAGAYEFLRTCEPFKGWRLPESDDVEFHVSRHRDRRGHWCIGESGAHRIAVSSLNVGYTETLIRTVAHEMIHLHQRDNMTETAGADHNAEFHRLARVACRAHGWDPRSF